MEDLLKQALDEVDRHITERLAQLEQKLNRHEPPPQASQSSAQKVLFSDLCVRYGLAKGANVLGFNALDFAGNKWPTDQALQYVLRNGGVDRVYAQFGTGVNTQSGPEGGFAIPFTLQDDIIEYLRANAVFRSLGATEIGPVNGPVPFLRIASGVTPYYVGEGMRVKVSKPSFEVISAVPKKLGVLVPFTGEWVRGAIPGVEQALRNDMLASIVEMEDYGLILGDGTQHQPTGLRKWALNSDNVFSATASPTVADVLADIGKLVTALKNKKIPMRRPGWIMSPRTERFLLNLFFPNGSHVYRQEMLSNGTLEGYPYRVTPQVPDNLGSGNDESFILFADFSQVYIIDGFMSDIEVSNSATFIDDASNIHSAFQQDMLVMRVLRSFDMVVRHKNAVAILKEVKWGA
ncbi:MAG: phage major capsid protein [Candidatus Methanomethylicaceae archaeon]